MERPDRRAGKPRAATVAAMTALALSLGCAKQPAPTAQPAPPASPSQVSTPQELPPTTVSFNPQAPSLAFLDSLVGTMPLTELQAPQALDDFTQPRTWMSSSTEGSMLLEAWTEPSGTGSQIQALEFDPASASYHVLSLDPSGAVDRSPAIAGGPGGAAMVLWASDDSGDSSVVGQVFDSNGQGLTRWNYRHGTSLIGQTALTGGQNGFLALWTQSEAGGDVVLAQQLDATGAAQGNPIVVSSTDASASAPAIAAGSNGYLAVWSDSRDGGSRVYGELLNTSGQTQTSEFSISDGEGVVNPRVTWDGGQYWVSWYDGRAGLPGAYDAFVQAVNTAGGLVGSNVRVSDHRLEDVGVAPRVVPQGSNDLVVFAGQAVDDQNSAATAPSAVYGAVLTPGATPSTPFAMTAIASSGLVDAQPWGSQMVVLTQSATGSDQQELDWSMYQLPGTTSSSDPFPGYGTASTGAPSFDPQNYGQP